MEAPTEKEPNWVSWGRVGMRSGSPLSPRIQPGGKEVRGGCELLPFGKNVLGLDSGPIVQMGTLRWTGT